jgi:hypothetical protein
MMDAFEAHAIQLMQQRFMVVVGGWGSNNDNAVSIYDTRGLPMMRKLPCRTGVEYSFAAFANYVRRLTCVYACVTFSI